MKTARSYLMAGIFAVFLSGCTNQSTFSSLTRELPPPPTFARKVEVNHKIGERLLTAAGRERAGRAKANQTITCFVDWYAKVRADYGAQHTERAASAARQNCQEK